MIAIYALNNEIARTAEVVSQPAIGDIRLAWWREAIEEVTTGKPLRAHPIVEAFAAAHRAAPQPLGVWERLIEARGKDLDAAPFARWDDLESYVDATAGGLMRASLIACGAGDGQDAFVRAAAQAWGCVGLLRAEPHWRSRGRVLLPSGGAVDELKQRARAAITTMKALSAQLPASAFPAVGYVSLANRYLKAQARNADAPPLILRQLRLIAASATGRF